MIIVTARVPKRRLLAGGITALCCCAVVAAALLVTLGGRAVAASAEVKHIRTNDDRLAYLGGLGWQVSPQPIATEELLIPEEFDDSYAGYLKLQQDQGFDLSRYCGKRVKRYTYQVLNHPNGGEVTAHLLLCKNTVVGGELMGTDFLCGLGGT